MLGSVWPGGREADAANTHLCCVYTCQSTPFEPVTLKATCTPVDITRKELPTCPPDYQGCILRKPSITSKCSDCGSLT